MFGGQRLSGDELYWKERLKGLTTLPVLPADQGRPPVSSFLRGTLAPPARESFSEAVQSLSRRHATTPLTVLVAGLQALIFRYTLQEDVLIGLSLSVSGSVGQGGTESSNIVYLRTDLGGNPSGADLMKRAEDTLEGARSHGRYPFSSASRHLSLQPRGSMHRSLSILLQETGVPGGTATEPLESGGVAASCDLVLSVSFDGGVFSFTADFDAEVFTEEFARGFLLNWQTLLEGIHLDSQVTLNAIPLGSAEGRREILDVLSRTPLEDSNPRCLHHLFQDHARAAPGRTALTFVSPKDRVDLTYGELDARSNRLAHYLARRGVKEGTLVGLCMDRDEHLVSSILGILKAGAAYVPLDLAHPPDRLALILEDADIRTAVTRGALSERLPPADLDIIDLDAEWADIEAESGASPVVVTGPEDLAYVIYTSGSTGSPKGVLVTHGNVSRLFPATSRWFDFGPEDVWTLFHSSAFDFSVWEMWGAFHAGGRLVVVPYLLSRSPEDFLDLLESEGVTVLNQTPSAFKQLMAAEGRRERDFDLSLRYVIFGGEALDLQSLRPWMDGHGDECPQLVNMYGITETTVHVTYRRIVEDDLISGRGSVIGLPLDDLRVYILDGGCQPTPVGVPGELYVGGAGVSRGYLNRPALTEDRFIPDPFQGGKGKRLYRTGDLGRLLGMSPPDIEYLGRTDEQVKIRGFRVELGEIESVVRSHPGVEEAAVVARPDGRGQRQIVAYLVPREGSHDLVSGVSGFSRRKLPEYMVPSAFVILPEIPLTPNGKLDRGSLPEPMTDRTQSDASFAPPMTDLEARISEIYERILGVTNIGVNDNFFELGGDSLLVGEVSGALSEAFGERIEMVKIFENPTIRSLAESMSSRPASQPDVPGARDRAERRRDTIHRRRRMKGRGPDD